MSWLNNNFLSSLLSNIGFTKKEVSDNNVNFDVFDKLKDITLSDSAIDNYFNDLDTKLGNGQYTGNSNMASFQRFLYAALSTNKLERIKSYKKMALFAEVGDAIDEICDASDNRDDENNLVKLTIKKTLSEGAQKEIQNEWKKYFSLFDCNKNMFEYMRSLCIEGELAWENIIPPENQKNLGVVGVKKLPPETFEFAINIKTKNKEGISVNVNPGDVNLSVNSSSNIANSGQTPVTPQGNIMLQNLNCYENVSQKKAVFLPFEQITYIHTGNYSPDGSMVYPVLEKARRAYNQLSLIEDSIIIYRLVRAPERLVFDVDVGDLPRARAEQEVLKLMKRYNTKKVYNTSTGGVGNEYDPFMMLESFWFLRPNGSDGTKVTTLQSGQNLGHLDDLDYFVRKLYLSLKIPYNRYAQPQVTYENGTNINYEEYRFAKFVMRLLNRFSLGFTQGFINHLKLRGLWDSNELNENDIDIVFTAPAQHDAYLQQQILQRKVQNYDMLANKPEFAKPLLMKKYLGWTDDEITKNEIELEKYMVNQSKIQFKSNNMAQTGNPNMNINQQMMVPPPPQDLPKSNMQDMSGSPETMNG